MSQLFKIPLQNIPQSFQIQLGGVNYLMTCRWNSAPEAGWVVDIADVNTGVPIVANIPLITGTSLLDGLGYLGISGELYVFTDGGDFSVPTIDNLGVESNVYFQTSIAGG